MTDPDYTNIAPRPGYPQGAGDDDRALFLKMFGQMLLEAWQESNTFENAVFEQTIGSGKSWSFPVIGRKREAIEHTPGDLITGDGIENNEVVITLDNMLVDSAFVSEIDALMASYSLAAPYARQLGESLSTTFDRRAAITGVKSSRIAAAVYTDGPIPGYYHDTNLKTNPAKIEEAFSAANEYLKENDVGGTPRGFLPWQQQLLMARYSGIDTVQTSGSGNRAQASIGLISGIGSTGSNHIPKTNITTGLTKYQGDFSTTVGLIMTQMAVGLLNRRGLRVTITEKEDRLGTLMIASRFCGFGSLRGECAFELATAVRS